MWRYATRRASKQKRRLLRFPGYYQYSNEIAVDLLTGAGLLQNVYKEHLLTYIKDIIMYTSLSSSNRQTIINDILYIKDILTYTSFFQATNGDN